MRPRLSLVVACTLLACGLVTEAARAQDQAGPTADARVAAEAWLAVVDSGRYADSWAQAARLFREALAQDAWDSTLRAVRAPLGAVQSRELLGAQYTTSLPNAPPGEYVVLQFRTRFANREQPAVETVVPMKGSDGVWRVSGWFVR